MATITQVKGTVAASAVVEAGKAVETPKVPAKVVEAPKVTSTPAAETIAPAAPTEAAKTEVPPTPPPTPAPKDETVVAPTPTVTATENGAVVEVPASEAAEVDAELPESTPIEPSIPAFKEESDLVSDLKPNEKKALEEFKVRILKGIKDGEFKVPKTPKLKVEPPVEETPVAVTTPAAEAVVDTPKEVPAADAGEKIEAKEAEAVAATPAAVTETPKEAAPVVVEAEKPAVTPAVATEKPKEAAPPVVAAEKPKVAPAAEKPKATPAVASAEKPKVAPAAEKPKVAPTPATEKGKAAPAVVAAEKPKSALAAAAEKPKAAPSVAAEKLKTPAAATEKPAVVAAQKPAEVVVAAAAEVVAAVQDTAKGVATVAATEVKAAVEVKSKEVLAVADKAKEAAATAATQVTAAVDQKTKDALVLADNAKNAAADVATQVTTAVDDKTKEVVAAAQDAKDAAVGVAADTKAAVEDTAKELVAASEKVKELTTSTASAAVVRAKVAFLSVVAKVEQKAKAAVHAVAAVAHSSPRAVADPTTAPSPPAVSAKSADAIAVVKEEVEEEDTTPAEDVSLWGVPLSSNKGDKRTDVVLLKFLRARDFNVENAFKQLKKTVIWRKVFNADTLLDEHLGDHLSEVSYMQGTDKKGHPVCFNIYGAFQDKDLYDKTFGDAGKIENFLRWRIQVQEKGLKLLNFTPEGPTAMVQINDLKDIPGKRDLKQAASKVVNILQDNYPEFVAKTIFINVPWYFSALYAIVSPFLSQRTKSKSVIAPTGRTTEALLKYIPAEYIPVQYGGLNKPNDTEFSASDFPAKELLIKAGEKEVIELPVTEVGSTVIWDLAVVGYEVSYGATFEPTAEGSSAVVIEASRKLAATTEEPVRGTFTVTEPGKVSLTIDNSGSKKKKIALYRFKATAPVPGSAVAPEVAAPVVEVPTTKAEEPAAAAAPVPASVTAAPIAGPAATPPSVAAS